MSERTSSLLILIGGSLILLSIWGLSILAVRWDTQRRQMPALARQMWVGLAVALPVLGMAIYLAARLLRGMLAPPAQEEIPPEARQTAVQAQAMPANQPVQPVYQPQPGFGGSTNPVARRATGVRYSFVVLKGPHAGQQFQINRLPVRIGRGPEVGIPLDGDLKVSRSHADLYEWNGVLRIRDLHSTHGTQINGKSLTDNALAVNDQIHIGASVLLLREVS